MSRISVGCSKILLSKTRRNWFIFIITKQIGEVIFGQGQIGVIAEFQDEVIGLLFSKYYPYSLTETISTTLFALKCFDEVY